MGRRGDRAVPIGRRRRLALLRRQGQGQDLFSAGLRLHAPAAGARRPRPVPASGVLRGGVRCAGREVPQLLEPSRRHCPGHRPRPARTAVIEQRQGGLPALRRRAARESGCHWCRRASRQPRHAARRAGRSGPAADSPRPHAAGTESAGCSTGNGPPVGW